MRDPMTRHAKRRMYLFILASATSFLLAILLYDLLDIGIVATYAPCDIFMAVGFVLGFKALEIWAFPNDYAGKETDEEKAISNLYAITFYIVAAALILVAGFLLTWIVTGNLPAMQQDFAIITLALLIAGSCFLIGRQSARENNERA